MTAVEWLVDKILVQQELYTDKEGDWIDEPRVVYTTLYRSHVDLTEFVQEAIEMERQQIETAYNKAVPFKYGKEYYEETFKNK
jgi:hypothetical protein